MKRNYLYIFLDDEYVKLIRFIDMVSTVSFLSRKEPGGCGTTSYQTSWKESKMSP